MRSTLFAVLLVSAAVLASAQASAQNGGGNCEPGLRGPDAPCYDRNGKMIGWIGRNGFRPLSRPGHGHHGNRGGHRGQSRGYSESGAVVNVYTWTRRTCVDWVMRGNVKVVLGTRAC